uniref:Uncharacterized protein n=1 Tax=Arundo donax TaxID=35708 RepID=A0A0A9FSZ2_ARUDO
MQCRLAVVVRWHSQSANLFLSET